MASTFCAMNERSARIWFSCLPWPSENLRSIPRLAAKALEPRLRHQYFKREHGPGAYHSQK